LNLVCLEMKNPESLRGQTSQTNLFVVRSTQFPHPPKRIRAKPNGFWHISSKLSKSEASCPAGGYQATWKYSVLPPNVKRSSARFLTVNLRVAVDSQAVRRPTRKSPSPSFPPRPVPH